MTAARDSAIPVVSPQTLFAWATEQAALSVALYGNPEDQLQCAEIVQACGGETLNLPIAKYAGSYMTFDQIACLSLPDEVLIVSPYSVMDFEEVHGFELCPNVFIAEFQGWSSFLGASYGNAWPHNLTSGKDKHLPVTFNLAGRVVEAVMQSWGC